MMIILLVVAPLCSVAMHAPIAAEISDSASSLLESGGEGGADDDIDEVRYWRSRALAAEASLPFEMEQPRASSILQESRTGERFARLPASSWSEDRALQRQLRETQSFEHSIAAGQSIAAAGPQVPAGPGGAAVAGPLGAVGPQGGALDPAIAGSGAAAIGAANPPCLCGGPPLDPLESLPLPPLPKPGLGPCGQLSPAAQAAQALGG